LPKRVRLASARDQVGACGHELQRHGVEIVDSLSEIAGALIIGSRSDQWGRAADSSDGVSGSWESACNLLMQHVRFFPKLEKSRRKISNARGTRKRLACRNTARPTGASHAPERLSALRLSII